MTITIDRVAGWRDIADVAAGETLNLSQAAWDRLDRVTNLWPQVEAALRLESADNELSRRPPQDYAPVVPEAPMGNVLGFQYLPDGCQQTLSRRIPRIGANCCL